MKADRRLRSCQRKENAKGHVSFKEGGSNGITAKNQERWILKSDKLISPNRVNESHFSERLEGGNQIPEGRRMGGTQR